MQAAHRYKHNLAYITQTAMPIKGANSDTLGEDYRVANSEMLASYAEMKKMQCAGPTYHS